MLYRRSAKRAEHWGCIAVFWLAEILAWDRMVMGAALLSQRDTCCGADGVSFAHSLADPGVGWVWLRDIRQLASFNAYG